MNIHFTTENLLPALKYMGLGMLGIFIVLFIIYLLCVVLLRVFPVKEEK